MSTLEENSPAFILANGLYASVTTGTYDATVYESDLWQHMRIHWGTHPTPEWETSMDAEVKSVLDQLKKVCEQNHFEIGTFLQTTLPAALHQILPHGSGRQDHQKHQKVEKEPVTGPSNGGDKTWIPSKAEIDDLANYFSTCNALEEIAEDGEGFMHPDFYFAVLKMLNKSGDFDVAAEATPGILVAESSDGVTIESIKGNVVVQ
ncbi:hypothetical protein ACTVZO_19825 [Streptomyces sp. IBSNAI002]|uniref:hypothetical protein n=1 Tax=Streptomyces sp. IBSNAI002 TaxID=3457500 RepID=UPI003FD59D35